MLTQTQAAQVENLRDWIERELASDDRFGESAHENGGFRGTG